MLASCSRDLLTLVYDVSIVDVDLVGGGNDDVAKTEVVISVRCMLRRPEGSACVCRVSWSPNERYLLTCTEEPSVSRLSFS